MFPKKTPLPIFLTRLTGTWTTSAGAYVKISFDQVCIDTAGWWDRVNARYIVRLPGYYMFHASLSHVYADAAANVIVTNIYKNGAAIVQANQQSPSYDGANCNTTSTISTFQLAVSGDYFEIYGYSSVTATSAASPSQNYMTGRYIAAAPANAATAKISVGTPGWGTNFSKVKKVQPF